MTVPAADVPAPGQPPVCPRHPDRVAYVRCQRCGRPVCPECQRPAAVGVQCVDCVAEAAGRSRGAQAPVRASRRPRVTIALIGLSVTSYLAQLATADWTSRWVFAPFLGEVEPWRFLTTAFLHSTSGVFHVLFNMVALWMVGPYLEGMLGRARFLALYLLSAVGGSVAVLLLAEPMSRAWFTAVVGASGAVFGLFGAVLVVLRRLGRDASGIVGVLVVNGVIGFVVPGIAWQAHLGGAVVGAALGAAFAFAPPQHRRTIGVAAPVATLLVLVALAALRYAGV